MQVNMRLISRAFEVDFDMSQKMSRFVIPDRHLVVVQPAQHHQKEVKQLPTEARAWCIANLKNYSLYVGADGYVIYAPDEDIMLATLRFS